ncbi:MAG: hypothetical protein RLZZ454_1111, partial [Pseudomonadota bacterium]
MFHRAHGLAHLDFNVFGWHVLRAHGV